MLSYGHTYISYNFYNDTILLNAQILKGDD